jgi:hypothetical protein
VEGKVYILGKFPGIKVFLVEGKVYLLDPTKVEVNLNLPNIVRKSLMQCRVKHIRKLYALIAVKMVVSII